MTVIKMGKFYESVIKIYNTTAIDIVKNGSVFGRVIRCTI